MKFLLYLLFALFLAVSASPAQKMTVYSLDLSQFPTITAKFCLKHSDSLPVQGLKQSHLSILENDRNMRILNFVNGENYGRKVSMAMSFDISRSMAEDRRALDSARLAATAIMRRFAFNGTEFALQTADSRTVLVRDFTENADTLSKAIAEISIGNEGNNFTEQMLNEFRGLLNIAKRGKNGEKIALLFNDGAGVALTKEVIQRCIDTCLKHGIKFSYIGYEGYQNEPNGIAGSFEAIARASGGRIHYLPARYYDPLNPAELDWWIRTAMEYRPDTCTVSWLGRESCHRNERALFFFSGLLYYQQAVDYIRPADFVGTIEIEPSTLDFGDSPESTAQEKVVRLTARGADIHSVYFDESLRYPNSAVKCLNCFEPRIYKKDEPVELRFRYVPLADTSFTFSLLAVKPANCTVSQRIGVIGGRTPKPPEMESRLKILFPAGGESVQGGESLTIRWTGTNDTVGIGYSTDKGASWNTVTEKAFGGFFSWTSPRNLDGDCLFRLQTMRPGPFAYNDTAGSNKDPWQLFGGLRITPYGRAIVNDNVIWDYDTRRVKSVLQQNNVPNRQLSRSIEQDPQSGRLYLLDLDSNYRTVQKRLLTQRDYLGYGIAWNHDGTKFILPGSSSYSVWDAETGVVMFEGAEEPWYGRSIAMWHPAEDKYFIKREKNDNFIIYDGSSHTELCRIKVRPDYYSRGPIRFSNTGKFLQPGEGLYNMSDCIQFSDYTELSKLGWHSFSLSPDDRYIAINYNRVNEIVVYDMANFTERYRINNNSYGYSHRLWWSPDGKYIIASLSAGKFVIYDSRSGAVKTIIDTPPFGSRQEWIASWTHNNRGIVITGYFDARRFELIDEAISLPVHYTAVDDTEFISLEAYPNPAEGKVSVMVNNSSYEISRIYLIDLLGQHTADIAGRVGKKGTLKAEFDTQTVAPGLYFIVAETSFGKKLFPLSVVR